MSTKFIGDHTRLQELVPLLRLVSDHASFHANGLTVYLDAADYSSCDDIRADFKATAFFWRKGNPLDGVPPALISLMKSADTTYIIWLSRSLLDSTIENIIWVYAHEFRHFMQACGAISIMRLQNFLIERRSIEGFTGEGTQLEKPYELDSELFAKDTLMVLRGEKAFSQYIYECRSDPKGDFYFRRFFELEALLQSN